MAKLIGFKIKYTQKRLIILEYNMSNFDWVFYVNFYTDIKAANINTEEKALEHYTTHGNSRKP